LILLDPPDSALKYAGFRCDLTLPRRRVLCLTPATPWFLLIRLLLAFTILYILLYLLQPLLELLQSVQSGVK
jgi:hypothetical protein